MTFGPLYREFSDLLLRHARSAEPAQSPALIREARYDRTAEGKRDAGLFPRFLRRNFAARQQSIETRRAGGGGAVFRSSLPDRIELLVKTLARSMRQFTILGFQRRLLAGEVRRFTRTPGEAHHQRIPGPGAPAVRSLNTHDRAGALPPNRIDTLVNRARQRCCGSSLLRRLHERPQLPMIER